MYKMRKEKQKSAQKMLR